MRCRWSVDIVDYLRECWRTRGLSASQCARAINEAFGTHLSRNAIIGKAYRLGLARDKAQPCARPKPRRLKRRQLPNLTWAAAPARPPAIASVAALESEPPPQAVTLTDLLPHHCRWPLGDPLLPGFRFCGAHRAGSLPYCAAHAQVAYRIVPMREERAA